MSSPVWRAGEVLVRETDSGVEIGQATAAVAAREPVGLGSVVIEVDPAFADHVPQARVLDPGRSRGLIERLYGSAVADAMDRATAEGVWVPVAGSAELQAVQRVGTLWWLGRRSPLALDTELLALETAVGQAQLSQLLSDQSDPAEEVPTDFEDECGWLAGLTAVAAEVAAIAGAVRSDPARHGAAGLAALVGRALAILDDTLPAEHRVRAAVRDELALIGPAIAWTDDVGGAPPPGSAEVTAVLDACRPVAAAPASARRRAERHGTSTVDWGRVPRGSVSPDEGAVRWRAEQTALDVSVLPPRAVVRHPGLVAAGVSGLGPRRSTDLRYCLYRSGWPLPLLEGSLAKVVPAEEAAAGDTQAEGGRSDEPQSAGSSAWTANGTVRGPRAPGPTGPTPAAGVVPLSGVLQSSVPMPYDVRTQFAGHTAEDFAVEVFDQVIQQGPRFGPAAQAAEAERWTIRALSLIRLGPTMPARIEVAQDALIRARELWQDLASTDPRPDNPERIRQRELAVAAAADCLLLLQALSGSDPTPVDFAHPGHRPLVTERWFVAGLTGALP